MISGYYLTQAISVAANLRLADAIGAVPKNAHELALAVHADESSLYRLLRALSSVGIFKLRRDGRFALAPLGQALRSDDSLSLAPWAIYNGYDFHWRAWGRLLDAVRDGTTGIEQISQKPFFTLLDFDPSAAKVFDSAMGSLARALNGVLVRSYDFSRLRSLVDVGGGTGNLLAAILRRNPRLRGTLYDLPHVVEAAAFNLRKQKLTRRCQVIGGDFFSAVPPGADAYILKQVLHDWSDAQALAILKMIRAAMGERGVLLVAEMVIPAGARPSMGKLVDLEMLVCTGGRERTVAEFRELLARGGFRLKKIFSGAAPLSIIEAVPRPGPA